ncbi:MAG TPA: dynamin family protein, partial [Acetobacteraceae bacterium]|nr:dynamin family protein [Acetobacteraceae bacterium]
MELRQYDRIKTALAELLRAAAMGREQGPEREEVRALFARLAEDRFNLVMVGRFSRGKSTLMNAMLGTDRLPTGIVPVTSVITTVSYGSEERVVLRYLHTRLFLDVPISELALHITERGNPGNVRRIRTAEVQLPAELLRRGFYFIDTPGLGSPIVENTRTTEAFLPEADAFVLVTSYEGSLTEEESRILEDIRRSGRRVFVVVNKQDCADDAERAEVLAHLGARLAAIPGGLPREVYSLSARHALEARLAGDAAALAASGLPAFEAALLDFLLNEKRREFLLGMCGRI